MIIREPRPDDSPALAELHVTSSRIAYRDIMPADALAKMTVEHRLGQWRSFFADPGTRRALVCELDGVPVGFALYGPCRDDDTDRSVIGELYALYVNHHYWSRGCGRALTTQVVNNLQANSSREAKVWALSENHRARRFYSGFGFALDGAIKDINVFGASLHEVRFSMSLTSPSPSPAPPGR